MLKTINKRMGRICAYLSFKCEKFAYVKKKQYLCAAKVETYEPNN
jgi:hypothetical protein